jgi:hypothetical protein
MAATGLYRAIRLDWVNPIASTFANTEVWRAAVNDRSAAVLKAAPEGLRGVEQAYTDTDLTPLDTLYYWRRPRHFDGTFDAYDPVSSTAGWSATVQALPAEDVIAGYRVVALTDAATVTPNADTTDMGTLATLSQATFFANPTGTPLNGQQLLLRILSSAARALTWDTQYRATTGFPLPASTTGGGVPDYLVFRWHGGSSTWDCVLQTTQAGGMASGWVEVTGTTQDMAVNTGYIANNAALVSLRLPLTSALGDVLSIAGKGVGGWRVTQQTSQQIHLGTQSTTVGTGGVLAAPNPFSAIELRCITADTIWEATGGVA